jgi:predicted SprT family Zn-dependent metalloprotease
MACKYFYDNKEYTFDEFASLLESGLADELVAKNVLSSSGVYNKKAPVDTMPGAITINSSNANVNVGKGDNIVTQIVRQSQRMVKAMSKLAPNLSFTIHATEDSWNQLREQMLANGSDITGMDGFYNPNTNEIHLNIPMMKRLGRLNTAYHEGYHPLTNALFNARPDLRDGMHNQMMIMSVDKTLPKEFRDQVKECLDFGNSYDTEKYGAESPLNEAIVEFLSRVSNGQIQIDGKNKTMMDHIRIFLNNLAGMFNIGVMMGNKEYTLDNLLDFARAMDFAIKQGVAIEFNPRNVPVFNSQDNIEIENGDVITSGYYPVTKALQASFTPLDINWDYAELPGNIQMVVPSNRESLADTLKKSGGAAVFINSDGTGVGVMSEDKYIDGGISYTFFKDNVDNKIGFAASDDAKIPAFYTAVKHAAEVRDKTNPEFKGLPVAVYVTIQSAPSTIGNYHGAEFVLDNIKEAIDKRKINLTELKKAFDYSGKSSLSAAIKALEKKGKSKENEKTRSYNKFIADLKSTKASDLLEKLDSDLKNGSFKFRLDILGNIIPNINVKSKTEITDFQNKLKDLNIDLPSFYNKYLDKNILNSLEGDTPGLKLIDNGFIMTGFYVDPYMTEGEYINKSKGEKFKHKQFNSGFHGTNPFVLNGKYYADPFFQEARFTTDKGKDIPVNVSSAGSMYPRTFRSGDFNEIIERAERANIMPSLAGEFVDKLNETKESDPKQYWSVDTVSLEDAKQGTVVKTEAGYGFVSQSGDIKGVFKANKESSEKTGDEVLKKAVKAGGIKLDNFDGYLTKIYERNGFVVASRIPFNEEYAPDGWNKEAHGTPDVVAMVYDPAKQLDIEEKRFEDYMEGIDYRDSFVDLAYGNAVTNGAMPPRIDPRPNDLVSASPIVYDMTEDGNGNYVFYTSNVSGKNADVDEDGMLNLSTQWVVSKEGKGDPAISSRNEKVQQAAIALSQGEITNEEYRDIVKQSSPIAPITTFFEPATLDQMKNALSSDKQEDLEKPVKAGEVVALRLDIPAYLNKNTWVVSVHDGKTKGGPILSYTNVAKIKNVTFSTSPLAALNIASGKAKATIARMFGEWVPVSGNTVDEKGKNAKAEVESYVNNSDWVQVGMNPFRHSYFYDRSSQVGRPVLSADEVVQVGGLVYAKNVKYGNWTDEEFSVKGKQDSAGKQIQFSKPHMVKVPYESTYPLDKNPLGLKPKIQPSIIGETGAAELDSAYKNMNNLAVAKKMKAQKKSKQFIKTSTGWELGPDGFWRMEISDSKFSYTDGQLNKIIDKAIDGDFTYKALSDVITNKQLFEAYPDLKKINVVFGKTGKVRFSPMATYNMSPTTGAVYLSGGYGDTHIIINSETLKEKGTDEILSYIEHEVQHYIQDKEGFTQGSDPREEFDTIISKIEDEIFAKSGKPLEKRLSNELNRLSIERNALAANPSDENKQKYADLYKQKLYIYDKYAKDVLKIGSIYDKALQNYRKKYGEVEARNVELRRLIPFELRADMLFEATQDIKNKDAIFTKNDKKIISKLETYRNKSILQQAKNLGFAAVVDKDMEGNAVVMSDTVMPAEPVGNAQHLPNKQAIQPSFGWAGSKGVQEIKVGPSGLKTLSPVSPVRGNVKELSNRQQSAFFNNFRTLFSATQGNSQAAKSLQERLLGEKDEIEDQINKNAIEIAKLVKSFVKSEAAKSTGLSEQTIYRIVNGAMINESDPKTGVRYIDMLPQDIAESVVKARQNIVTLQEALIQSGLLPAEIEAIIANTIGSWSKRSFFAFELKKNKGLFSMFTKQKKSPWFESVTQDVRDKAKVIFTSMAMNGTLDNGFNIALNEYKKNFEDPYLALLAADPTMQSNATQQAAMAMQNALADLQVKASEFADAVMRQIEDVNQAGDVNFTIGGSIVSMKDYIEKNPALPKEIRDYLGEIKDPAINFRLSAMKLTRMLYNHQTVAQFKNLGLQSGDVVTASEPTPAGWIKLGDVSKADVKGKKGTATDDMDALNRYGALKGCSISPALYDLLFDSPIEGTLYYKYITTNVKKFKTIYSPSTQIKNLYGYAFFGLTSGAIPEGIFYSAKIASSAYKEISTQQGFMNYWNNIFVEAKRRGINTSLEIQEINRVGKELSENKEMLRALKGSSNPATDIYQFFTEMYTNTEGLFKQGMMLGDAIPKTIMFEIFRNTNAAILNNTSYYELDERQKEIADEMAGRRVKLTTVTDTRTIKGIDFIQRKMGIFGTFPRFLSESIRNFVNAHLLIVNPGMLHEGLILSDNKAKDTELKKQMDLKTRGSGMAGLAGYYGLMALLKAAISFGDDDDDKVIADIPSSALLEAAQIYNKPKGTLTQSEALRMLVPEYDRFADLSFEVKKDGTIEYKNESSVDPFNVFPQAFRSYVYSENVGTGTANAAKQIADPVIGWEILFGTALEVIRNENSKGNVIYKNYDDFIDKSADVLTYAFRKVGPGIATSSMRYSDLVKGGQREGGAFGYINFMLVEGSKGRISTMDVESKLKSKVSEINNSWIDDQRSYKGDFYKDKSEEERKKLNQERDNNARMYAYELNQLVEAGYTLGLSTGQVKQVFKDARVSKKVRKAAMRGGSYIDKLNIDDIKED